MSDRNIEKTNNQIQTSVSSLCYYKLYMVCGNTDLRQPGVSDGETQLFFKVQRHFFEVVPQCLASLL